MFGAKRIIRLSTYSSIFAFACTTDPRRVAGGRAQVNHVAAAGIGRRSARGAVLLYTRTPRALCERKADLLRLEWIFYLGDDDGLVAGIDDFTQLALVERIACPARRGVSFPCRAPPASSACCRVCARGRVPARGAQHERAAGGGTHHLSWSRSPRPP